VACVIGDEAGVEQWQSAVVACRTVAEWAVLELSSEFEEQF